MFIKVIVLVTTLSLFQKMVAWDVTAACAAAGDVAVSVHVQKPPSPLFPGQTLS